MATANSDNNINRPQEITAPKPATTDLDYSIPDVPGRGDIYDPEAGEKIQVSSIYTVNIQGQLDGGSAHETPFSDAAINAIIAQRLAQLKSRLTFGQLQQLAVDINRHLNQQQGYLLATMYVPAQEVKDGAVKFALLKGKLGEVRVEGNQLYDSDSLTALFGNHLGEVVKRREAEEALLRLQDFPGFSASGVFSPGDKLGYTSLTLNVNKERRYDGLVFADNYGSAFTGNVRGGGRLKINNLMGWKDRLSLLLYFTEAPKGVDKSSFLGTDVDCCDGSIGYEWGIDSENKYRMGVEVFTANYDIGDVDDLELSNFNFEGKTRQYKLYGNYQLSRGRKYNGAINTTLSRINAKTRRSGNLQSEDKISQIDVGYRFDLTDGFYGGGSNFGNVQVSWGKLSAGSGNNSRLTADSTFSKLNLSLNRSQKLTNTLSATMKINGQYSRDKLVGIEQMSLGGPASIRAYPSGAFLADKAIYGGLELLWNVNEWLNPYTFIDYASARIVEGESFATNKVHLGGYGLGMNWRYGQLTLDVTAARALGSGDRRALSITEGGRDVAGRKSTQVYASLQYSF